MDYEDFEPPPMSGATYKEIETSIFDAIDRRICTGYRIKLRLGHVSPDDVEDVLAGMELDGKIVRVDKGQYSGYFRSNRVPSRFWLEGNGKCGMEFGAAALKPARGTKHELAAISDGRRKNKGAKPKPVDYAQLQGAIARKATLKQIHKTFGITSATFYNRLKADPEFKAAVERGKQQAATV